MNVRYCALSKRGFIRISGADKIHFLQGLITNNAEKLSQSNPLYALLLSPQGKFLYDFFLCVIPGSDDILMETQKENIPPLLKKLTMYKLRSNVMLEDVSDQFESFAILGEIPDVKDSMLYKDPRHSMMGMRLTATKLASKHWVDETGLQEVAEDVYRRHRISLGLAVGGEDMVFDESYPLHFGMDHFKAIDFNKGCYVGQEVTARTKHRGGVKKSVAIVATDETIPTETLPRGTELFLEGKLAGSLCSSSIINLSPYFMALALVQTEALEQAKIQKMPLMANGIELKIAET